MPTLPNNLNYMSKNVHIQIMPILTLFPPFLNLRPHKIGSMPRLDNSLVINDNRENNGNITKVIILA